MLAVVVDTPGGPEQLRLTEVPEPEAGPGEVLVEVAATAVNRADLMQRQGFYDPPPGATRVLGLECSGTVTALGDDVGDWQVGDQVCALLSGGGYAQRVAVPVGQLLPVPDGVPMIAAAGLPEVACTVWSNLVMVGGLRAGQLLLAHGGTSGIGTMAIQIGKALGARVAVTGSRDDLLGACRDLGADLTINYRDQDFVEIIGAEGGADLILDVVGAKYLERNIAALADGGRVVVIGFLGGVKAELNLSALMAKRGGVISTALRSRPATGPGSKAEVVAAVREHVWPMITAGTLRPVIDAVLPLAEVAQAHERIAAGGHLGKIVLTAP